MKIAISATGPTLDGEVDLRFGRCPYFIIGSPETMEFEAVSNPNTIASCGAGISSAQMIANKDVQVVLTGNSGPNANQVLSSAGIQVMNNVSGKIRDAIEGYRLGKLKANAQANAPAHFGMDVMSGRGKGVGRGMGMGCGRGRGMGMRFGGTPPTDPVSQQQSQGQELQMLKAQAQEMTQQLAEIQRRLKELENK